jgi:dimethylargininase
MSIAVVREVPSSFGDALCAEPPDSPIDVGAAREEHAAYVAGLGWLGLTVTIVPTDEGCPDCCFIEDTAVSAGDVVIAARPGAPSRRAEVQPVLRALVGRTRILQLTHGTLDGGDCLRLGRRLYVGRSARTSEAAITELQSLLSGEGIEVIGVPVPTGVLHLKCLCSALDDDTVLLAEGEIEPATFAPARCVLVPRAEAYASNVVAHARRALVPAGFPRARALIEDAGFTTREIDNRELRKADSALTCLSIILPR